MADVLASANADQDSLLSYSSVSTNETADNLPGPGRIIGNLFSFAGRHLERKLNNIAKRSADARPPLATPTTAGVEQTSLVTYSSASSNATADNLVGPGRILGNVYGFAGRRLERRLGSIADQMGYGPRATAVRIERRRAVITSASKSEYAELTLSPAAIKAKSEKVEKDCRRMLKYIRSNTARTKKQALDRITDLSVNDSYVRGLLKVMGAVDIIGPLQNDLSFWINYGAPLQSSSRKALITLDDVEVNVLVQKLDVMSRSITADAMASRALLIKNLNGYLGDPNRSFLVLRHIQRLSRSYLPFVIWKSVCDQVLTFIDTTPADFEWEQGDRFFEELLSLIVSSQYFTFIVGMERIACTTIESILRYADRLPRTINSESFLWLTEFDKTGNVEDCFRGHYIMYFLIQAVAKVTRADQEDIDSDLFHVDPSRLLSTYPHSCLQPFLYSEDGLLRERAWRGAEVLLALDVYRRNIMLQALSSTKVAGTTACKASVEETRTLCRPAQSPMNYPKTFQRHCDSFGNLIHTPWYPDECDVDCEGADEDILEYHTNDVLPLHIPKGTPFSLMGHQPLLAGYTAQGERAYVAMATLSSPPWNTPCTITEGARPEDLRVRVRADSSGGNGRVRVVAPVSVDVDVLAYELGAYARSGIGVDGLDATGPFSWRFVRRLPSVSEADMFEEEGNDVARLDVDDGASGGGLAGRPGGNSDWADVDG
ncbi:hypothetical protein M0805_009785 [Coniferiporia weirii]|nr:hypothetical protein M0805_009785 [Coniferiporia weirii]